jgi:uncharacterized membrane protein YagU involved in acid resistance
MTAHASTPTSSPGSEATGFGRRILIGALGGIAGGLVFGAMMATMGMLPMLAGMVGSTSPWVGFGVHMMISVFFGVIFTAVAYRWLRTWGTGLLVSILYGIVLWVVGPLVVMPMMMGGPLFALTAGSMMSFMGHVIYALVLGAVAVPMLRRRS